MRNSPRKVLSHWSSLSGVVLLAAFASTVSANGISKWIDADGGVHYGDQPPPWVDATPVSVRPNVIDTDASRRTTTHPQRAIVSPQRMPHKQAPLSERGELRSCEWEARAMIDGPATVLFPGDPYIFARPDLKPPPPGLPLKFRIVPTP